MTTEQVQELQGIANSVARRYRSRCWWADIDDLKQEAMLAIIKATSTFDPRVGVDSRAYYRRAAVLALHVFILKQTSPVSETWNRLPSLCGVYRAPLEKAGHVSNETPAADEQLDEARYQKLIKERLARAFGSEDDALLARAVLLEKKRPQEVAHEHGVEVTTVYRATRRVRQYIEQDRECYDLWRRTDP